MLQNVITDVTSHTPNHKLSLVSLLGPSISAISAEIGMMQKLVEDLSNGEATNLRVDAATTQYSDYLCSFQHSQDPIPALTCLWTMERVSLLPDCAALGLCLCLYSTVLS